MTDEGTRADRLRDRHAVLSTAQIYAADAAAAITGVPSLDLMENAGRAVARIVERHYARVATAILAGPGNNGGDGYVIARHLADHGWPVTVWRLGAKSALKGDAKIMAGRWRGPVKPLSEKSVRGAGLIIDALFGAGLQRPLGGLAAKLAQQIRVAGVPVVSVDLPSGLDGDTGMPLGPCFEARQTVSFFRKKNRVICFIPAGNCVVTRILCKSVSKTACWTGSPHGFGKTIPICGAGSGRAWLPIRTNTNAATCWCCRVLVTRRVRPGWRRARGLDPAPVLSLWRLPRLPPILMPPTRPPLWSSRLPIRWRLNVWRAIPG